MIPPEGPLSLDQHAARYGPLPRYGQAAGPAAAAAAAAAGLPGPSDRRSRGPADSAPPGSAQPLIAEVERSGLTGRGGAGFPCGRKMRAVAQAGRGGRYRGPGRSRRGQSAAVLVANGAESEPASGKDQLLLHRAPHLVLDGVALAAEAVGAGQAYLCLHPGGPVRQLREAVAARGLAGLDRVPVQVLPVPPGYLTSQEGALVSYLNGLRPQPSFVPPRPSEQGVHRRPTLVQNVETLAHVALIARYGAGWFRQLGTAQAAGTALVTVTGAVGRPGSYEIALGTPLDDLVRRAGGPTGPVQAVLAGGYLGGWLPGGTAPRVGLSEPELRAAGAAFGPGVLVLLPASACGLAETARVTGYLASQSAGQCGPCRNGLPALAQAAWRVAFGQPGSDLLRWTRQLADLVTGRGACHLPDGAAALVTSALRVFDDEIREHARYGRCERAAGPPVLPVPGILPVPPAFPVPPAWAGTEQRR